MTHPCPIRLDHGVIGDGRVLATVDADERLLVEDGLELRYCHNDDFGETRSAFTHVGLINTAVTISELLEARDARFRAWS